MSTDLFSRSARRRAATLVALFYALVATAYPVLHATAEAPVGDRAVEPRHSADCRHVHNEVTCLVSGSSRGLPMDRAPQILARPPVAAPRDRSKPTPAPRKCENAPTLDRGPPFA